MATPKAPDDDENLRVLIWRVGSIEETIPELKKSDKEGAEIMEKVADRVRQLERDFDRRSGMDRLITIILSLAASGLITWAFKHLP